MAAPRKTARSKSRAPAPAAGGIQKPHAVPGTVCPLFQEDVSLVCHTCEWWDRQRVRTAANPPEEYDHWACAFKLMLVIARDIGAGNAGIQKAVEDHRNEDIKRQDQALEFATTRRPVDVSEIVRQVVGEAFRAIAAAQPAAINGGQPPMTIEHKKP